MRHGLLAVLLWAVAACGEEVDLEVRWSMVEGSACPQGGGELQISAGEVEGSESSWTVVPCSATGAVTLGVEPGVSYDVDITVLIGGDIAVGGSDRVRVDVDDDGAAVDLLIEVDE
jgi:hypothetical protein